MKIKDLIKQSLKANLYYYKNERKLLLSKRDYQFLSKFGKGDRRLISILFGRANISFSAPFWFLHSVDEIFVNEVYKFFCKKNDPHIIDCGANIGLSVLYFKKLYPNSKITAIEADPDIHKLLVQNISSFKYSDVELLNAAVYDSEGSIKFSCEGSVGGKISSVPGGQNKVVSIPTTRLKSYLNQKVDFLKIDIEGAEYQVLKDCKDNLSNVECLFVEYHEEKGEKQKLNEVLEWICNAGFNYYIKEAWNNMSTPFTKYYNDHFQQQLNIFCFRPETSENKP